MTEDKKAEERRKNDRIPVTIPIIYNKIDETKGFLSLADLNKEGTILDISSGGVKILADESLKEEDYIEIKILVSFIPDCQHFFGHVKWTKIDVGPDNKLGHTGGVCFVRLDKKIQGRLLKKLNQIRKGKPGSGLEL